MTTPAKTPLGGARPLSAVPGGGARGPALAPLPPKQGGAGRWWRWLVLVPLLLIGVTYLLGRTVDPVRLKLVEIPLAGKLLFSNPVWPILWNKPITPEEQTGPNDDASAGTGTKTPGTQIGSGAQSDLNAEIAARLAAVELKEKEIRDREQAVRAHEGELRAQETRVREKEAQLTVELQVTQALKAQLEGQLRAEQDRVEVIRKMSRTAQVQLFNAMTDDEILRVLHYMEAEEIGKIFGSMDPYRAARLMHQLTQIAPGNTSP